MRAMADLRHLSVRIVAAASEGDIQHWLNLFETEKKIGASIDDLSSCSGIDNELMNSKSIK